MVKSGDYFVFPGGGTQFKDGVDHYIESVEQVWFYCVLLHEEPCDIVYIFLFQYC